MSSIVILGAGNVAFHLTRALIENTCNVRQIFNRTLEHAREIGEANRISYTDKISEIEKADIYIIASADSGIEEFSHYIPYDDVLVVHTSGSSPMSVLKGDYRKGVFYPLQSFTKNKPIDFKTIPICLESENATDYQLLDKVAKTISDTVFAINSEQRKALHVAAVFVNNFTNHLYQIGQEICLENKVPFEILKPLIAETANKIMVLSPEEAQTGPAKRNDTATIEAHEAFLSHKNHLNIYKTLTQSIQENGKKL